MGVKGLAPVKTEGLMGSAFVLFFFLHSVDWRFSSNLGIHMFLPLHWT